jgi:hypothetical protein
VIQYGVEIKFNYPKASWRLSTLPGNKRGDVALFKRKKDAESYIFHCKHSYPNLQYRIVKLKREKIY